MSTTLPTVVAPTPKLGGSFLQNLGAPVLPGSALELNFLATGISHLIDNALNGIVVTGDELTINLQIISKFIYCLHITNA